MEFIGCWKFAKIDGFLDTEEKIRQARIVLEKSTEKVFEELKFAKMQSWQKAGEIVLD